MSKYRFSYCERYALWGAYKGRCFYCEKPLDFQEMTIDHVLPESLTEHPGKLMWLRREYEIDESFPAFQINDFSNWVPAHFRKCNACKGNEILPKNIVLLLLDKVHQRLPTVRQKYEAMSRMRGKSRVLGSLGAAIEKGHLSIPEVRQFVAQAERAQHTQEPFVLTFSLMMEDVVDRDVLPSNVRREYAYLCDWLELDLVKRLRAAITTPFHYTQPSERSGEGLSVRIVFPGLDISEIEGLNVVWWEILEAANFWDIFGEHYEDAFPELPEHEYFGRLKGNTNEST